VRCAYTCINTVLYNVELPPLLAASAVGRVRRGMCHRPRWWLSLSLTLLSPGFISVRHDWQVRPVLEDLLLRNPPSGSLGDAFSTSATEGGGDRSRRKADTTRQYGAQTPAGRDTAAHKGFGDNRRGSSTDRVGRRPDARTVSSAEEARGIQRRGSVAGSMGAEVARFAHPAAAAASSRRPSGAGDSQYQR
jgi:hypothetical protein